MTMLTKESKKMLLNFLNENNIKFNQFENGVNVLYEDTTFELMVFISQKDYYTTFATSSDDTQRMAILYHC